MFYFQQLLQPGIGGNRPDGDDTSHRRNCLHHPADRVPDRALSGGLAGRRCAVSGRTGIKYLVVAIILANWSTVFREVNDSFNQVAQFIDNSSGAGDMFLELDGSTEAAICQQWRSAHPSGCHCDSLRRSHVLLISGAYLIYALMVIVFGFFYILYGCVLYVLGPLVLALLPMAGVGQLAKSLCDEPDDLECLGNPLRDFRLTDHRHSVQSSRSALDSGIS